MLQIELPGIELFNDATQEFMTVQPKPVQLEHSLISLSKWEARWKKSFLATSEKSREESVDYIRCMTLTQNLRPTDYAGVDQATIAKVNAYIDDPMTATTFTRRPGSVSREIVTSELIYYWMIACSIPFECQKWHLNRLMTLIQVCNAKDGPQKNMSKRDILAQNRSINAVRRQKTGSRG